MPHHHHQAPVPVCTKLLCIEMKVPRYGNPIFALSEFITVWIIMCTHCIEDPALHYCQDQFASYQSNSWSVIHSLYNCPIVYLQYYSTEYGFRYLTKGIKCILVLFVLKSWSQVNSQLTMRQGPLPVYAMNSKQRLSCQCQCGARSEARTLSKKEAAVPPRAVCPPSVLL